MKTAKYVISIVLLVVLGFVIHSYVLKYKREKEIRSWFKEPTKREVVYKEPPEEIPYITYSEHSIDYDSDCPENTMLFHDDDLRLSFCYNSNKFEVVSRPLGFNVYIINENGDRVDYNEKISDEISPLTGGNIRRTGNTADAYFEMRNSVVTNIIVKDKFKNPKEELGNNYDAVFEGLTISTGVIFEDTQRRSLFDLDFPVNAKDEEKEFFDLFRDTIMFDSIFTSPTDA